MQKILVLYAHPGQRHSRVNTAMAKQCAALEHISCVDLYAEYPRLKIDVAREQARLLAHDIIIMQFPLMWYSTPSVLKEWQDLVLQYGFAYGENGNQLAGKHFGVAVSAGSTRESYSEQGIQRHSLPDLLRPLYQMANLCQMQPLPPYVLFGALANHTDKARLQQHVQGYSDFLCALRDQRFSAEQLATTDCLSFEQLHSLLESPHD